MCVVQPIPYEPCHGRPDSQPARPRLPPGCGSQTRSSLSAGGPPPLHTPYLKHKQRHRRSTLSFISNYDIKSQFKQHDAPFPMELMSALTSALIDSPRLLIKVIGVRFVKIEAFAGVGHRRAMLWLVWEGGSSWQNWAGQVCLGAAMWIPLVRQLQGKHQQQMLY